MSAELGDGSGRRGRRPRPGAARLRQGRGHRRRRHPARQVPPQGQVPLAPLEGGFGFCNVVFGWDSADVCYDNAAYTGWHSGYPDAQAQRRPRRPTARCRGTATAPFFLGDFVDARGRAARRLPAPAPARASSPAREAAGYARQVRPRVRVVQLPGDAAVAAAKGFRDLDAAHARACSATRCCAWRRTGRSSTRCSSSCGAFGVPLEGLHTETGPGVFEAAILLRRRARGRRPGRAVQDRRPRRSATASAIMPTLHGQVEHRAARVQRPHPPEPLGLDGERNVFYDDDDAAR